MIRAVAKAQIRERFATRRKALEAADASTPFWLPNHDPKLQAEQRALAREEQKALQELLGPDPESGVAAGFRRSLPNVAPDKILLLAEIRERYNERTRELYADARGSLLPEEAAKLPALEKAMYAEVAALLSPAELEEYDLRVDRTANQLRYTLSAFDANEAEFRTLHRLQRSFDDQLGTIQPGASPEQMRARSDAQRQLQEEIRSALGPDRYADYQRATDYNYRRTTQVVERLSLPPETANELYALQKSAQQRATDLRRDGTPMADRPAHLRAIVSEAEEKISARLGPTGLEVYRQYAGTWLNNIAPRPTPPSPKR